jgi:hypothetical protein
MTRRQRAASCAVAVVPVTVAGAALLRCGCPAAGWAIELATAAACLWWITRPVYR